MPPSCDYLKPTDLKRVEAAVVNNCRMENKEMTTSPFGKGKETLTMAECVAEPHLLPVGKTVVGPVRPSVRLSDQINGRSPHSHLMCS